MNAQIESLVGHGEAMDRMYRFQRHIYDVSRRYYLLGRDEECLHDIRRTLELEPRHFAAMLHFAEILLTLRAGAADVRFACFAALSLHPHLPRARELYANALTSPD